MVCSRSIARTHGTKGRGVDLQDGAPLGLRRLPSERAALALSGHQSQSRPIGIRGFPNDPVSAKWKMPERLTFPGESWNNAGSSSHRNERSECLWKWSPKWLFPRASHKRCEVGIKKPDFWESGERDREHVLNQPRKQNSKIGI